MRISDSPSLNTILENTKNMSVLYVEDDKAIHESTKNLLENFYKKIDSSFNGEDGLKSYLNHIDKYGKSYDLVITDIRMPQMSGMKMCKEIIKKEPLQMIIVISADNNYVDALRELYIGFLPKPIGGQKFSNLIFNTSKSIAASKPIL